MTCGGGLLRHAHKDIQGDVEHLVRSLRSKPRQDQFRLCCHRAICPGQLVKEKVFRASAPQSGSCASVVSAVTLANDLHDSEGKSRILWRLAMASEGDSANARNILRQRRRGSPKLGRRRGTHSGKAVLRRPNLDTTQSSLC